ncbi:unnamed protein product, partial [Polarella glacialis]
VGFISQNSSTHRVQCIRSSNFYAHIVCPAGHYKLPDAELAASCSRNGLKCDSEFSCVCKPCAQAFEVQVLPKSGYSSPIGCAKMDICGRVEQGTPLEYVIRDNRRGGEAIITYTLRAQGEMIRGVAQQQGSSTEFLVTLPTQIQGSHLLEIFMNGRQISESPLIVQVDPRNCKKEKGPLWDPTSNGECICTNDAILLFNECYLFAYILCSVLFPLAMATASAVLIFNIHKRKQNDAMWHIELDELIFPEPVQILGHGTFGLVVKAEYRGTAVAVKRVMPAGRYSFSRADALGSAGCTVFSDGARPAPDHLGLQPKTRSTELSGHVGIDIMTPRGGRSSPKCCTPFVNSMRRDSHSNLQRDFIQEMRVLCKLRHPCVTTVMGAVVSQKCEFMLVMELMDHGSLHDLLNNTTVGLDGELVLPILRDVVQGMHFLHAAKPAI